MRWADCSASWDLSVSRFMSMRRVSFPSLILEGAAAPFDSANRGPAAVRRRRYAGGGIMGAMSKPRAVPYVQPYRYASPNVPMRAIRRFARQIAEKFHPDKIILIGSYAYGTPHNESDVDLLVIMPCRNAIDQAIRIDCAFDRPFSLDLIVRT